MRPASGALSADSARAGRPVIPDALAAATVFSFAGYAGSPSGLVLVRSRMAVDARDSRTAHPGPPLVTRGAAGCIGQDGARVARAAVAVADSGAGCRRI